MNKRTWILIFICLAVIPFFLFLTPMVDIGASPAAEPVTTEHFQVQWGGTSLDFHSVEGLESRLDVVEYREGLSLSNEPRKVPGNVHHSNIILRRIYKKADNEMWDWYKLAMAGRPEYRDITISILNRKHEPVITFRLSNAWPCAYRGPILFGEEREVALEEMEIAYESLDVEND